ncbi:MAG: 3-hydroxyacyl-CoA dehydrogenase family protein [Actinomycetia bacterium]|nr:3-hydroxyacyl-CoA dehydrogenase family protein [Actinomycetes bacterium]
MKVEDIKKVAVFGAGTMGPGVAQTFAAAGYAVAMYSRKAETLEKAMTMVRANFATLIAHGAATPDVAEEAVARIEPTQSLEEAGKDADFVLETIAENKEAKKQLYGELETVCPERTIFASNTSSLNIFELLPTGLQTRSACAHFFTPAHIIPLVEVVPGPETTPSTMEVTVALMKACGKSPVVMKKFGSGFIVNRIQRAIGETAMDMVEEGLVEPEEIDVAVKTSLGIRLPIVGVMQTFDFQGLDMLLAYQQNVGKVYSFVEDRVRQGAYGAKSGRGIYDYQGRSEVEILRKRDELYLKMLDYLKEIGAFEPV